MNARPRPVRRGRSAFALVATAAAVLLSACEPAVSSATEDRAPAGASVSAAAPAAASWRALAGARVWFGHQSVGGNLMDGVEAMLAEAPAAGVRVVKVDSAAPASPGAGSIAHFYIGENGNPASKLAAFARALDAAGADSGVAMMKFCYLDMRGDTDPAALFADYQRTIAGIRQAHPGLTLVHATMPLTTVEGGAKAFIKSAMGKVTSRDLNARREQYNALLRRAYEGREPVFDLARLEATGPDGTLRAVGGTPVLAAEYTDDGGHLNARGQRAIGTRLVETLARVAGGQP